MPHSPSSSSSSEAERDALLPCPFCGAPASGYAIAPHTHALRFGDFKMPDHVGSYVIEGNCSCGSGLIGATQGEVTARWNARATPPSLPIDFKQASEQGGLTAAARDVLAERQRQLSAEGWTPEHDDEHWQGEMLRAAVCYAWPVYPYISGQTDDPHAPKAWAPSLWPWDQSWWKPKGRRQNLTRAAALILAEIERLDRASPHPKEGALLQGVADGDAVDGKSGGAE